MNSIFNGHPYMTDATVENPDYSEAELITVEPEEDASKEEKDQVDFDSATEARVIMQMHNRKMKSLKKDIAKQINRIANLYKALNEEKRISPVLRTILLEEGIVDSEIISDSAAEDAETAFKESDPSEIAEKGASEEELTKASMRAQHRVLMSLYRKLN